MIGLKTRMADMLKARLTKVSLGVVLAGALVACGSDTSELELSEVARSLARRAVAQDNTAASQLAVLQVTRAQVESVDFPLIRVRLEGTGAMSTMLELDRKGGYTTYVTGDGIGLLFRDDVLVGSRGLGQDLMGLSTPGLATGLKSGQTERAYRYLDGDDRLATVKMTCLVSSEPHAPITILERSYDVDQVTEWCRGRTLEGAELAFENFYWVESGTGLIWQSRQYISPKFGRAEIEVLTRK